jgi:hypothetical protein
MFATFIIATIVCFKQLNGPNPDRVIATMAIALVIGILLAMIHDAGGLEHAARDFYIGWTAVDRR